MRIVEVIIDVSFRGWFCDSVLLGVGEEKRFGDNDGADILFAINVGF